MQGQVLDLVVLPEAVSSWVHVDFIKELLPNEVQKIGRERALAKVNLDYQSQEQPPQRKEREVACLKQDSRCFQSLVLRADRAEVLANRILEHSQGSKWFCSSPL
jgi:hypothetical protein